MLCSPFRGSCLPLSPIVPLLASCCWIVHPPSGRRSFLLSSPIVPLFSFLCWMARPGFQGSCLALHGTCTPSGFPLYVLICSVSAFPRVLPPFVSHRAQSWLRLLDGPPLFLKILSPSVSHCTPSSVPLLDNAHLPEGLVSLHQPSSPSNCTHSCFPLLDCMSAFPKAWSPAVSHSSPP